MKSISEIESLVCTIRGGEYVNNGMFSKELVREYYRALSNSGVNFVGCGKMARIQVLCNKASRPLASRSRWLYVS
jgi:hypothetical protein